MKIRNLTTFLALCLAFSLSFVSCSDSDYSYNTNSRTLNLDDSYEYGATPAAIGKLGRVLFYDNALSINNSVSCGSCHKQSKAFADDKALSKGFENLLTDRNTPPIQNLNAPVITTGIIPPNRIVQGQALFWDGRERLLQNMVVQPVFNHVEMGMSDTKKVVEKVMSKPYYEDLFIQAFGDEEVTFERISIALTGFVGSISTMNSLFDMNAPFGVFNVDPSLPEQRGADLFMEKYDCSSCHNLGSPTGYSEPANGEFINIGLDANYEDKGRGAFTGEQADDGKFRIPSLRNIALTGPYMHDGRFETLEEVLDHYSVNIVNQPNLDDRLRDESGKAVVLNISEDEKQDLIAFLHTLTDVSITKDPRYSDPFLKR